MCDMEGNSMLVQLGPEYEINLPRVSAGLKFASDILSKQPQYCSDIRKFFRTFFQTFILPP